MGFSYKQSGIAIVIVLWMLALLTIIATTYAKTSRSEILTSSHFSHNAQARGIAEAGISLGIYELLKPDSEQTLRKDNTVTEIALDYGQTKISILEETAKIDLNTAHSELLGGLLYSVAKVEPERVVSLVDAILDWRDRDKLVRPFGAEDSEYIEADLDYAAKDGPFNTIDELLLVMGMDANLFNKIKPVLTIHSHYPGINPQLAPKDVLLALPGITVEVVDAYIDKRNNDPDTLEVPVGVDPRYFAKTRGNIFTVTSKGSLFDNNYIIEAVVLINNNYKPPYKILSWAENSLPSENIKESVKLHD